MNLKTYTAKLVRSARTNFYYAFAFLPHAKRDAIYAAYAFSRHTDDIVDDAESTEAAQHHLNAWRTQLDACYKGTSSHLITQNLQSILSEFPIPKEHFLALIDGVEMDLHKNRYHTFDELRQYCYRVASVIGLICIEIFGYTNPQTRDYAINLGLALQLTNIMRDVYTDWQQGRIYLPGEDLEHFNYTEPDLSQACYNPAFIDLMHFQSQRAWSYYQTAANLLPVEDKNAMFSAQIMGQIYSRLLMQIERANYNIFDTSIRLNNLSKLSIALRYWLGSRFSRKSQQ